MKKLILLFVTGIFVIFAKAQVPHLTGRVNISMATGQLTCDFSMSNIPDLGKDYQLLLNKGFNIKSIKNADQKILSYDGFYNGKMMGEGIAYIPLVNDSTFANPKQLHISYTGAFPIYSDTSSFIDFKGLIAFNGHTLRAAEQSKWYPVIYDAKKDQLLEEITYNITITCDQEASMYLNGSLPAKGKMANFTTQTPVAPLLFVGKYTVIETKNALFLNSELNIKQLEIFEKNVAEIKAYYGKVLTIPYATKNVFIEHQPVEKYTKGRSWAFATYPAIAFGGMTLQSMVNTDKNKLKDSTDYTFIAHEIAHYYFGNVLKPNSLLKWFFLESTAEYLSFKAGEAKYGQLYSASYLKQQTSQLKNFKAKPLKDIKDPNELNGTYRYHYGPLLLRGLEQIIGEKRTFAFLTTCLKTKDQLTDYAMFKACALKSGVGEGEWSSFEKEYLNRENATALIKY